MSKEVIKLGDKGRDMVTGFEGIATSRVEYLNGCVQFCLTPPVGPDGKRRDGEYFDSQQVEVVKADAVWLLAPARAKQTGGPTPIGTPTRYAP